MIVMMLVVAVVAIGLHCVCTVALRTATVAAVVVSVPAAGPLWPVLVLAVFAVAESIV